MKIKPTIGYVLIILIAVGGIWVICQSPWWMLVASVAFGIFGVGLLALFAWLFKKEES